MQTSGPATISEVNALVSARRLTEAAALCQRILEENPSSLEARRLLGVCLLRGGSLEEAEGHLLSVRAEEPLNAMVLVNLGYLREEQGRLDDAELMLMLALMLDPKNDFAHGRYGNLMRRQGRETAMESFYRKLMGLFPEELVEAEPFYRSILSVIGPLKEPKERRARAAIFAAHAPPRSSSIGAIATERGSRLRQTGFAPLGQLLSTEQAEEIRRYFVGKLTYNALLPELGDKVLRPIEETLKHSNYACYRQEDIVHAPYLLEAVSHPDIVQAAAYALGCQPTLYSINAWWSFPQKNPSEHAQAFHRDIDDFLFTTFFMYLTDVNDTNGPHVYCAETHDVEILEENLKRQHVGHNDLPTLTKQFFENTYGMDTLVERYLTNSRQTVRGPAGTAFIADTFGLHKGILPTSRPRLMFWARFGLHEIYRRAAPVERTSLRAQLPEDPGSKYTNRMYVRD